MTKRKLDELNELELALGRKTNDFNSGSPQQKVGDLVDTLGLEETCHASFELGTAAYRKHELGIAISTTSIGLDAIINQQIALLDIRAAAYGMAGQFELGLRDAEEMIRLTPHATAGYRRAGELYCMQGYASRAIKVYQEGLEKVNDQHSSILLDDMKVAKALCETRVDFIANAPYDIVTNILQHLTSNECIPLLDISKAWRRQISECSAVWTNIKISNNDKEAMPMSFLTYVGHHVTSIYLEYLDNRTSEAVFSHIASGIFGKLGKITIEGCSFERNEGFFSAISHVSMTLKELTVRVFFRGVREPQPKIPFNTVLVTCRNLQSFEYRNQSSAEDRNLRGYLGFSHTSTVTSLILGINHTEPSDLADTLRFCPNLQHLKLIYFASARNLDIVNRYCKNLVSLSFNYDLHEEASKCIAAQAGTDTGVRHMALRVDETSNFTSLFTDHCATIESLNLYISPHLNNLLSLSTVGEFSNLQYLKFSYGGDQLSAFAASMIANAPRLRYLAFQSCDIIESELAREIARSLALEKLEIRSCSNFGNADFVAMFEDIAAKSNTATLREVVIREGSFTAANIMESLTNIRTLRRIDLAYCSGVTREIINQFCKKLQLHPCIESILLAGIRSVRNQALEYLSAVNGLKRLELRDLNHITDDGLSGFDRSVTLVIADCKNIGDTNNC